MLWTILPLAIVLIALSLAGVTRHRQAMTRLVEDRDRGLATAEANRLGREIAQRTASLTRGWRRPCPSTQLPVQPSPSPMMPPATRAPAWRCWTPAGTLRAASPAAAAWAAGDAARILATRTVAVGQPQYETELPGPEAARLLIAVPAGDRAP